MQQSAELGRQSFNLHVAITGKVCQGLMTDRGCLYRAQPRFMQSVDAFMPQIMPAKINDPRTLTGMPESTADGGHG